MVGIGPPPVAEPLKRTFDIVPKPGIAQLPLPIFTQPAKVAGQGASASAVQQIEARHSTSNRP
jgi:hypothetical protein